jgi:hypothetical protein
MVTSPEVLELVQDTPPVVAEDTPRYALQRSRAARRGHLPSRLLLNRARSEGEAHRRLEESTETDAPFSGF